MANRPTKCAAHKSHPYCKPLRSSIDHNFRLQLLDHNNVMNPDRYSNRNQNQDREQNRESRSRGIEIENETNLEIRRGTTISSKGVTKTEKRIGIEIRTKIKNRVSNGGEVRMMERERVEREFRGPPGTLALKMKCPYSNFVTTRRTITKGESIAPWVRFAS
ncbi:hypothetical protein EVAR_36652_1 [Eumeta japonica]|uniref:Uncharacterized protein n=1 Tax=Eumeta variegata TaxID=151549 RepID=A0A4C1XU67_EUMVA|nr:hypothetical protein EVAR_36652_1 [Eumeta japonica]